MVYFESKGLKFSLGRVRGEILCIEFVSILYIKTQIRVILNKRRLDNHPVTFYDAGTRENKDKYYVRELI